MIRTTILPFKLGTTEEQLTSQAGLVLVAEAALSLGVDADVARFLRSPGSNRGYDNWQVVLNSLLMLHGGGRSLEDLRVLRGDQALCKALDLQVCSSDTLGRWLHRHGSRLDRVFTSVARRILRQGVRRVHTLDIDATFIEAHKRTAAISYHGDPGYYPMTGWLAESGLCIGLEFRAGNVSPNEDNGSFIERCRRALPGGHRIGLVRIDAAGFQDGVFDVCRRYGLDFVIRAPMNARIKREVFNSANVWRDLPSDLGEGQISETWTITQKSPDGMRLVVVRRPRQQALPGLERLTSADERYFALVTTLDIPAEEVVRRYNARGQAENLIKELKIGYGMERLPCGDASANAAWLCLGGLAYNLGLFLKTRALEDTWQRHTVATLRWRLYATAARLVRHAGAVVLKISGQAAEATYAFWSQARRRLFAIYLQEGGT